MMSQHFTSLQNGCLQSHSTKLYERYMSFEVSKQNTLKFSCQVSQGLTLERSIYPTTPKTNNKFSKTHTGLPLTNLIIIPTPSFTNKIIPPTLLQQSYSGNTTTVTYLCCNYLRISKL